MYGSHPQCGKKWNLEYRQGTDKLRSKHQRNHKGWTPLMTAAYKGRLPMVSELLNKGANINSRSNDGQTALLYAAFWGYLPIVKLLLNRGANINVRSGIGYNALMYAVISRNLELVRLLLKHGANTNGVLNRRNLNENSRNAIIKHKAGLTIAKYKKTSNMRRRAASAKALNNVRTPNGRPLPQNSIRLIMSMLKPRSPQKMRG